MSKVRRGGFVAGAVGGLVVALLVVTVASFFPQPGLAIGAGASPSQGASVAYNTGTSVYLGYIPKGYDVAPLLPGAQSYPCPSNDNTTQCAQFKASCGNGVCDPDETCSDCPIDCGVPTGLTCDPYTGRASGLGGVCELTIPYSNANPSGANNNLTTPQTPGTPNSGGASSASAPSSSSTAATTSSQIGAVATTTSSSSSAQIANEAGTTNASSSTTVAVAATTSSGQQARPSSLLTSLPREGIGSLIATLSPLLVGLLVAGLVYGAYARRQDPS